MRRGVLPTIRPLNVNPLHGSENLVTAEKTAISEVSCEDHVGDFFDWQGVNNKEFVPEGEIINAVYYKGVMESLLNRIRRVRPGMCESGDWFLLRDNAPSHNATIVKQFLDQRKVTVLDHPPYSPDLAPADYVLFPKVKSHLKGSLFYSISDVQKPVTSTLNTTAKDDFYKGIQKLYGRANLCVQLEGTYVEN